MARRIVIKSIPPNEQPDMLFQEVTDFDVKEKQQLRALEESGEILIEDGIVYRRVDHFEIDVTQIPDYVQDNLAAATYEAVTDFLRRSGGREKLDELSTVRKAKKDDK